MRRAGIRARRPSLLAAALWAALGVATGAALLAPIGGSAEARPIVLAAGPRAVPGLQAAGHAAGPVGVPAAGPDAGPVVRPAAEPAGEPIVIELGSGETHRASRTLGPLVSHVVIVPGDARSWSLAVRNDGEGPGVLSVQLIDVRVAGASDAAFEQDFRIGDRPLAELLGRRTLLLERPMARGAVTEFDVGYDFATDAASGNHAGAARLTVRFDLELTLRGVAPSAPGAVVPVTSPRPSAVAVPTPSGRHAVPSRPDLAASGADVLRLALLAFAAAGAGTWLLAARRRRDQARAAGREPDRGSLGRR